MDKKIIKALSLVTQLALSMLIPIALCFFAGKALDSLLGTSPLLLLLFILLGIGAGFRSIYMITKPFFSGKDTYIDIGSYKKGNDDGKKGH